MNEMQKPPMNDMIEEWSLLVAADVQQVVTKAYRYSSYLL